MAWIKAEEPPQPALRLPKMEVSETAPPAPKENWRYASFGNFEVLAKASDLSAGGVLAGLQEFDHALRLIFPALAAARPAQPIALLLPTDAEYRNFAAVSPQTKDEEFSRYLPGSERTAIVVNMDATEATGANGLIQFSTVDPSRQLNRQYLRHLFTDKGVPLPAWLEEGLAQTIADIEFNDAWMTYGKVITAKNMPDGELLTPVNVIYDYFAPNPALSGLSFKETFSHRRLLPLSQLFQPPLPAGSTPSSDSAWAKQSYAFVHFCLFGNRLRYRAPLMTFVEQLQSEPPSERLFFRCFGVNQAEMLEQLRGYLLYTRHQYQRYALKKADRLKAEPVRFREAADDEITLIKGAALQLAGNETAAQETYRRAYLRGVRTPDYLAAYAEVGFRVGDRARAQELLGAALAGNTLRPSAYVLQARMRFEQYSTTPDGSAGKLSDAQLAAVLEPLLKARQLQPPLPEAYLLIAEAWSRSQSTPKPENLAVLDEGIRLFPRQSLLLARSIEVYRQVGDHNKITSIAKLGMRFASDAKTKADFASLAGIAFPAAPEL